MLDNPKNSFVKKIPFQLKFQSFAMYFRFSSLQVYSINSLLYAKIQYFVSRCYFVLISVGQLREHTCFKPRVSLKIIISSKCLIFCIYLLKEFIFIIINMEKNIESFFEKKKRGLSDKSKDGDERKKQREGSLEMSIETDQNEVFSENSNSSESPNTLLECFKKLEAEVKHLSAISTTTRDEQIKGTGELKELNKSIIHSNERIEAYEKEKIEREKQIEDLKEEVHDLKEKLIEVDTTLDRREQYSRRNCLPLHGIKENDHEDTDLLVMSTLKETWVLTCFLQISIAHTE